jgi:alpha-galactosidase
VYSLCQYGRDKVQEWGPKVGGNLWRSTGDIRDQWQSMTTIGFAQSDLAAFAAPGHWNDPDMLEVGNGGMSVTEFLTNREVIAVDEDKLGRAGLQLSKAGDTEVWAKPLENGAFAVALFNLGPDAANVSVSWADLKLSGAVRVRDLWEHSDRTPGGDRFTARVDSHGVVMIRVWQ